MRAMSRRYPMKMMILIMLSTMLKIMGRDSSSKPSMNVRRYGSATNKKIPKAMEIVMRRIISLGLRGSCSSLGND